MSIKPMILTNDDFAEGVYAAASGSQGGSKSCNITGCWTGTATLNQHPELGQECYTVDFKATHAQIDHLHQNTRIIVTFNENVRVQMWNDVGSYSLNGNVLTGYRTQAANNGEGFGGCGLYIYATENIGINSVVMDENY